MTMEGNFKPDIVLLAGTSHPQLCALMADRLAITQTPTSSYHKSNRETVVEINESIRGKDVYILQTGTKNVNNDIMELLVMAYACKTTQTNKIVAVMPYLPYCKQSKMRKRGCIVSKLLAKMMAKAGIDHLITMDLHQKEIQGFFECPVDNVRAAPFLIKYIEDKIPDYKNAVIIARNANAVKRATSFAERLRLNIAVIHGEDKRTPLCYHSEFCGCDDKTRLIFGTPTHANDDDDDGRSSPPIEFNAQYGAHGGSEEESDDDEEEEDATRRNRRRTKSELESASRSLSICETNQGAGSSGAFGLGIPNLFAKHKPPMNVVGDVGGRIAIIVDDMIDDVKSFVRAADLLKQRGAYKIYIMATHGLLSSDAPRLIEASCIDEVVVTNTVPHDMQKLHCTKIKTVDVSVMLSEAIRRIHYRESMSVLFNDISLED